MTIVVREGYYRTGEENVPPLPRARIILLKSYTKMKSRCWKMKKAIYRCTR